MNDMELIKKFYMEFLKIKTEKDFNFFNIKLKELKLKNDKIVLKTGKINNEVYFLVTLNYFTIYDKNIILKDVK